MLDTESLLASPPDLGGLIDYNINSGQTCQPPVPAAPAETCIFNRTRGVGGWDWGPGATKMLIRPTGQKEAKTLPGFRKSIERCHAHLHPVRCPPPKRRSVVGPAACLNTGCTDADTKVRRRLHRAAETEVLGADGRAHRPLWWVNTEVLRSGFLLLLWVGLSKQMTHPVLPGPE